MIEIFDTENQLVASAYRDTTHETVFFEYHDVTDSLDDFDGQLADLYYSDKTSQEIAELLCATHPNA